MKHPLSLTLIRDFKNVINVVHVGKLVKELIVRLDFFLQSQHLALCMLLGPLDEFSQVNELLFVFRYLADPFLHVVIGS